MPFPRPTLTTIKADIAADISSNLPGANGALRFSVLGVIGKALAALVNATYGYLDWIAKQCTPFTATGEFLAAWGALKGVFLKGPVAAQLVAQFPGSPGYQLPQGLTVVFGNFTYQTTETVTVGVDQSSVNVTIEASLAPTDLEGSLWNAPDGAPVTLGAGVPGIGSSGSIVSTTIQGVDVETQDAFRARVIEAYQTPPAAGAQSDYVGWAEAVAGVTRAWCWPHGMGLGSVLVYVMEDTAGAPGFPTGTSGGATGEARIPAATGDLLVVANAIFPQQPGTALVYLSAPLANDINFTISGWNALSGTAQTAVEAAIDAVLLAQGNQGGLVDIGAIEAAVQAVSGAGALSITAATCTNGTVPAPLGNITSAPTAVPCRGTIEDV